jgi:hypothetical protein
MKRFLAIITFMDHFKKDKTIDYWRTNKFIETPIFDKSKSRNKILANLESLALVTFPHWMMEHVDYTKSGQF